MPHRVPAAAGSWFQLSVCAHPQGSLLRQWTQMWKMVRLTYNFISHAKGLCGVQLSQTIRLPWTMQTIIAHVPRASNCYCEIDAQTLTMHALSQSQKCLRCIGHATPMPNACTCHSSALALVVYRLQRWVQETSCQWITQPWKPSGLQREARQGHL